MFAAPLLVPRAHCCCAWDHTWLGELSLATAYNGLCVSSLVFTRINYHRLASLCRTLKPAVRVSKGNASQARANGSSFLHSLDPKVLWPSFRFCLGGSPALRECNPAAPSPSADNRELRAPVRGSVRRLKRLSDQCSRKRPVQITPEVRRGGGTFNTYSRWRTVVGVTV
jgi:hypothetical protein